MMDMKNETKSEQIFAALRGIDGDLPNYEELFTNIAAECGISATPRPTPSTKKRMSLWKNSDASIDGNFCARCRKDV